MQRADLVVPQSTLELLVTVPLWRAYGSAENVAALWQLFCDQSDLAQIGSITCLMIFGHGLTGLMGELAKCGFAGYRLARAAIEALSAANRRIPAGDALSQSEAVLGEKLDQRV